MIRLGAQCTSARWGYTPEQEKAARNTVQLAIDASPVVDVCVVQETVQKGRTPFYRVKARKSEIRVIVEIQTEDVIIHAILPRTCMTYERVAEFWRTYR